MDLSQLYKNFRAAKKSFDVEKICDCIVDALKIRADLSQTEKILPDKLKEILEQGDLLVYQALKYLGEGNVERAKFYAYAIVDNLTEPPRENFNLYYILGRVNYLSGNYVRAAMISDSVRGRILTN